ncbi:cation:proton antiporter [Virgibacillus sp. W0430]|uniref:cation:proton antiporter n=1 Tax=Virgibacillus sp. W0430 TaxID=3391580 RepID=UPI003F44911D
MTIVQIVLLLTIGYFIFTLDMKQNKLPVPVILVIIGIGLSFTPYFATIKVTEDMIYSVFLPSLLFISAYQFSSKSLKKHAGIISFLSTIGIIATMLFLGLFIYYFNFSYTTIPFLGALLLATILTPTDPVSVVSVLKQSSDNPDIAAIVDGESMINDGTSIVLFSFIFDMYVNGQSLHMLNFIQSFLFVSFGGIAIGLSVGWLLSKAVHIFSKRDYQVMLSIVIAYGGFHLAEHFGVSGVLATVTSGIMLSWEFSRVNKEDHYREKLDGFWGVIEPSLLSLLFLLIGIEVADYLVHSLWAYVIVLFFATIFIRFLIVLGTMKLFSKWNHISLDQSFIISWSGIKGTMSIFLLLTLTLASTNNTDTIVSIGFSVVLLSLIIQSIGVYPLSLIINKRTQRIEANK